QAFEIVKKAVKDIPFKEVDEVFSWSEDFGQFSQIFPSCFVGLGAGVKQAQLHNENYDFPDAILEDGIQYFKSIINAANNE
ncbi:MAG: M20/M25/M40 family metallo-hydrolase, partial [Vicingaceae bacterium]